MAELKTKPTTQSATDFINTIEPERREDGLALITLFQKVTKEKPIMWGTSIVGFGVYHYKSERSTREGDWLLTGFSPRKQNFTLYIMTGGQNSKELLEKLGKHKISGSCLHINKLSDVNEKVLAKFIKKSFEYMKKISK